MHPRNPHQGRYDFPALVASCPALRAYLRPNPAGDSTIDFSNPQAVVCLNQALLAHYYRVAHWQIPAGYLCPPIPGRADYIHYLADLLAADNGGVVPTGKVVRVLDIGTGANCIYPIIGSQSYGWQCVGTDIDPIAVKSASVIVQSNPNLSPLIRVVEQRNADAMFTGVVGADDRFDLTLCNPPFHASPEEAAHSHQRKVHNLGKGKPAKSGKPSQLNFGGQAAELWCPGGELVFLKRMMRESVEFAGQIGWFSSLVSKGEHVLPLRKLLAQLGARQVEVVAMAQGQKISRFMAWRF